MEHFIFEQYISESHISVPPEQVSMKANLAAANEEWKERGDTYIAYLIAAGSICGIIPVMHQVSKKFN